VVVSVPCQKDVIYHSCPSWNPRWLQSDCRENDLDQRIQMEAGMPHIFLLLLINSNKESVLFSKSSLTACYSNRSKTDLIFPQSCSTFILSLSSQKPPSHPWLFSFLLITHSGEHASFTFGINQDWQILTTSLLPGWFQSLSSLTQIPTATAF
jgi:hypothetical protein